MPYHRLAARPGATTGRRRNDMRTSLTSWLVISVLALPCARCPAQADSTPLVVVGDLEGAINPATTAYVDRLLGVAAERRAVAVVLRMDTPGGLSASMRDVVQAILASSVPVVVYVWPEGAHAASAGALIALSAHFVAMAPGTNIGAAHPVSIGGGESSNEVMDEKVTNDAAAYARSLADRRGRSVEWAERVVRESISSTAEEAVKEKVADLVASDLDDVLARLDGRRTSVPSGEVVLRTAGAQVEIVSPSFRERFLARIADPNIAYLLLLVGVFGILFELQNPGSVLPGVAGVVSIVTAAYALQMLPIRWTGVALIALAIVLFILEVKVTSHGLLTIGGVAAMFIGSVMLVDSPLPFMRVSLGVIIPSVIFTALFFLFAVGVGIRAQRRKVTTGHEGLVGAVGTARSALGDGGTVFVRGELWSAESEEPIEAGASVEVVAVDGMKVRVRRHRRA
jgi:membrane-bound serine protease (ClpP class)